MRSTRLIIVRHGESAWNVERRVQGQADPPLSEVGRQQARALAEAMRKPRLAALYCSPLHRARETAALVAAPHGLRPQVVDALREIDLGVWQGRTHSELSADPSETYRQWRSDPSTVRPPGGETLDEALDRVVPAVEAILSAHVGGSIALVTHSIVGRALLVDLLGAGLDLVPRLKLKQASATVLRLEDDGPVLERLSYTCRPVLHAHHERH